MGNRGLLRATDAIAKAAVSVIPIRFGQVFLAAPDVDTQLGTRRAFAVVPLKCSSTSGVPGSAFSVEERSRGSPSVHTLDDFRTLCAPARIVVNERIEAAKKRLSDLLLFDQELMARIRHWDVGAVRKLRT
jgi:hypothetical protein